MNLDPLKPFIVGIDPGKNTGVAILRRQDDKIIFSSGQKNFYDVQLFITRSFKDRSQVTIFVEHPKTMLYERNESEIRNEELRIMFHAGGNRREAELMAMCLKARRYEVHLVPPVHEKKWTQEKFELFTRSHKRTNEHERDAIRLAVYYANYRKELAR